MVDFGEVPVDVIETATYQVSIHGFAATKTVQWPDGIDRASIPSFLANAVDIAERARGKPGAQVALSLGPYGSTMVPGQEYSGAYDEDHDDEEKLLRWWAERLSLFAEAQVWERVAYVACETIPRLDEIKAVRRAIPAFTSKPLWISCVFPAEGDGFPDGSSVRQVVRTILAQDGPRAQPWGIGINCTKLHKLQNLVAKYEEAVIEMIQEKALASWPALVLYPDGTNGEVYNTTTQRWELPAGYEKNSVVAVYIAGETLGALAQTAVADKLGRVRFMMQSRGLVATVPIYLSEISAPSQRGLIGGISGCGISFGTMMSNWVGMACGYAPYGPVQWRLPLGLQVPWGVVLFIGLATFMPNSPRQLIRHGKVDQARQEFTKIRRDLKSHEVHNEFVLMRSQIEFEMEREIKSVKEIFLLFRHRVLA
ncbi:AdoMet-homocysteine methyltransferase [Cytospora paraplurivora]|uniref:AdoMet-homocysteine methyltransferase n=1 Tax=Cytospora paraplurivora TaxID=2898453 RepID=A0AAN9U636_9PEZI